MRKEKDIAKLALVVSFAVLFLVGVTTVVVPVKYSSSVSAQERDVCQTYYDKAKELAAKAAEELPSGHTLDFDPRVSRAQASRAYSEIYRVCKEYVKN